MDAVGDSQKFPALPGHSLASLTDGISIADSDFVFWLVL
jgi:hypothetical protein